MKRFSELSVCLFLAVAAAPIALHAQTITFAQPKPISVGAFNGQGAFSPIAGDFNGDGKTDYLVNVQDINTGSNYQYYKVLLGDGTGNFSIVNFTNVPASFDSYLVADVNGDGKDDIVFLQATGNFKVFLSDGNGHFTPGYTSVLGGIPGEYATGVVGDFNHDGKPDVAVLLSPSDEFPSGNPSLVLFLNQGHGSFLPVLSLNMADIYGPYSLVTGDFNGDGNLDLAMLSYQEIFFGLYGGYNYVYTLSGNGKSGFDPPQLSYSFASQTGPGSAMQSGNLTGSPKTDLVVSLFDFSIPTLVPKAGGGFYWLSAVSIPQHHYFNPFQISLSDLNGDGKLDLIGTAVEGSPSLAAGNVYPGLGNGKFGPSIPLNLLSTPKNVEPSLSLAVAPLQRGGLPSLMIGNGSPTLELLVNTTKKP